jgi:hypothetical protein
MLSVLARAYAGAGGRALERVRVRVLSAVLGGWGDCRGAVVSYRHPWLKALTRQQAQNAEVDRIAKVVKGSRWPVVVGVPSDEIGEKFLRLYRKRHPDLPEPGIKPWDQEGRL